MNAWDAPPRDTAAQEAADARADAATDQPPPRKKREAPAPARGKDTSATVLPFDPACPHCGKDSQPGERFDGEEYRCAACGLHVVAVACVDSTFRVEKAGCDCCKAKRKKRKKRDADRRAAKKAAATKEHLTTQRRREP